MKEIIRLFPPSFQRLLKTHVRWESVQEIRLRVHRPIEILDAANHQTLSGAHMTPEHLAFVLNQISQFSLYRLKDELKEGFITIEGGHRVGLAGKANTFQDQVETLKYISFMNIRVAKATSGQVDRLIPYLYQEGQWKSTMIIGPPHSGKTTLLRELSKYIGTDHQGYQASKVAVVDERSEIAASMKGVPQLDVGVRTDVMDACPKAEGMMMMIRSMSPDVLIVDEIGGEKDAHAIREAAFTGVHVVCSIHGETYEGVQKRPSAKSLIQDHMFERYIVLSRITPGKCADVKVLNEKGQALALWKGRGHDAVDRRRYHPDSHYVGRL